jgi:hypothetical protein
MDFSSESGVGGKFALWDSEETGLSRSPGVGARRKNMGVIHTGGFRHSSWDLEGFSDGVVSIG